jgi:hypothetical protein
VAHITFVHGICNKPPLEILLDIWERRLRADEGLDLGACGVTTQMVYWCDVLYALPLTDPAEYENTSADTGVEPVDPVSMAWEKGLDLGEKRWVAGVAAKFSVAIGVDEAAQALRSPLERNLERIPLPWPVKRRLVKTLLRDTHHYLFDSAYSPRPGRTYRVRNEIRQRMQAALAAGAGKPPPHIVVAHGIGSVIAYDCLKRLGGPAVDAMMTIGSPLGIEEVQDCLKPGWSRDDGFPRERVRGAWVNVYDGFDPVTGPDPVLANDYRRGGESVVEDVDQPNSGLWRHNISQYLAGAKLRARLAGLLGW